MHRMINTHIEASKIGRQIAVQVLDNHRRAGDSSSGNEFMIKINEFEINCFSIYRMQSRPRESGAKFDESINIIW